METKNKNQKNHDLDIIELISILCGDGGVSPRRLCSVLGEEPHTINKLHAQGLLNLGPYSISVEAQDLSFISSRDINSLLRRLRQKTCWSIYDDLQVAKEYNEMGFRVLLYVLDHSDNMEGVNWIEFSKLLVNLSRWHQIYGRIEKNEKVEEHSLMRAVALAKRNINTPSALFGTLCTVEAYFKIQGFHYKEALPLLHEAFALQEHLHNEEGLSETYFMYGMYYALWGDVKTALYYYFSCYEGTRNADLKTLAALQLAYELAVCGEVEHSAVWTAKVITKPVPKNSEMDIYLSLVQGLKDNKLELVEKAELKLLRMNTESPFLAKIYLVQSLILHRLDLGKDSNKYYLQYAQHVRSHFASTDGALILWRVYDANRYLEFGASLSAQKIVEDLEKLDLAGTNPSYALGVRYAVLQLLINFYRGKDDFAAIQLYCNQLMCLAKDMSLQEENESKALGRLFGNVPPSISGEIVLYKAEEQQLVNLIRKPLIPTEEKANLIEDLMERFPSHSSELELTLLSLKEPSEAIRAFHRCITHADCSRKLDIVLSGARYAVASGLFWDAVPLFDRAVSMGQFDKLQTNEKINILLEVTINLERCCERKLANMYWKQLEQMAEGSPLLWQVYRSHAQCLYDQGHYSESILFIDKAISIYEVEDVYDEIYSSMLVYRSTCFGNLRKYSAAYADCLESERYYPSDQLPFNMCFNHAYFTLAMGNKDSQCWVERCKALAKSEEEHECVSDLLTIVRMDEQRRKRYFGLAHGIEQ